MRKSVADEKALDAPLKMGGQARYVRSLCDPRVLIHGQTGDNYIRDDGAKWEYPAYKVDSDVNGKAETTSAPAHMDDKRYPPGDVLIEQYFALGDGLSMDPLLAETPTTSGPASLLASNLARNHSLGKFKNLCRERSRMSNIWLYALPSILPTRGEVVVTISTGLEDIIDMGLELSEKGMIHSAVHETIGGYRRLVRTLRRLLPNALIIGTTVPDPTTGTGYFPVHRTPFPTAAVYLFNDLLKAYADKDDRFVVADVFDALSQQPAWSSPQNIQLSTYGCDRVSHAWLQEIQKAGMIPAVAA